MRWKKHSSSSTSVRPTSRATPVPNGCSSTISTSWSTSSRDMRETSTASIASGETPHAPRFPTNWRVLADLALSTLFEPPCAACGAILIHPLSGAVCDLCWAGVHRFGLPVCDRCGDPLPSMAASLAGGGRCRECSARVHEVDRSRAVGAYEGRLRDIVHALKYGGRRSIAPRLGLMMREAGADLLVDVDCVVPVPLHPSRERARGFNQADDLARALGAPVVPMLRRTRSTRPQVDLPAADRARNVQNAFTYSGNRH